MILSKATLTVAILAGSVLAQQADEKRIQPALDLIQPIRQGEQEREPFRGPFVTKYQQGSKELVFLAAAHSTDLDSPTHQLLIETVKGFEPDFIIVEGVPTSRGRNPERFLNSAGRAVRNGRAPESMLAAKLATDRGVPFVGGEEDGEELANQLIEAGFSHEAIMGFHLLRAAESSSRPGANGNFQRRSERLLDQWNKRLGREEPWSYEDFLAWYEMEFGKPFDPKIVKRRDVAPIVRENAPEHSRVSTGVEMGRERHLHELIANSLNEFDKVLVVYGSGHLLWERAALKKMLGDPVFTTKAWPGDSGAVHAPTLAIGPVPQGQLEPFGKVFQKYINVFGVHVFATKRVSDAKLRHAAAVLAEYLDNDEDGIPDNREVVDAMATRDAFLFMTADERELERLRPWEVWDPEGFTFGQFLHAEETNPGNGRFDAALEEDFHLVSMGYAEAYPDVFGPRRGTVLAECLDDARGGHWTDVPRNYPENAWFTYDDETCEYSCQAIEYVYWALTSLLGGQADSARCREISEEWRPCTPEQLREMDPAVVKLLTDPRWRMPTRLPDGNYAPASK